MGGQLCADEEYWSWYSRWVRIEGDWEVWQNSHLYKRRDVSNKEEDKFHVWPWFAVNTKQEFNSVWIYHSMSLGTYDQTRWTWTNEIINNKSFGANADANWLLDLVLWICPRPKKLALRLCICRLRQVSGSETGVLTWTAINGLSAGCCVNSRRRGNSKGSRLGVNVRQIRQQRRIQGHR